MLLTLQEHHGIQHRTAVRTLLFRIRLLIPVPADNPVYVPNTNVITRNASRALWTGTALLNSTQSTYVTSAAFWKLREVSLSYDVPVKNILGGAIKDAQVGIVGRNLIMLRPRTNIWTDPEFNHAEWHQQCCWLYY